MNPNNRHIRLILLLIVVISFAVNYHSVYDTKMDRNGDNLCYFLLGKNLSEGNGYVLGYEPQPVPYTHFPPGYPVFLAGVMKVFPYNTVATIKVINGLLFLLSLCILFRIIRKTVPRYGMMLAFLTTMLCTLHPELLRWSTIMMSEMLYLTITMAIIAVCIEIDIRKLWRKETGQFVLLLLLCVLISCAYLTRTMGVTIAVSVCVSFVIITINNLIIGRKHRDTLQASDKRLSLSWLRPLMAAFLVAFSLLVSKWCWDARNHRVNPSYTGSYTGIFMSKEKGKGMMCSPDDWADRVSTNLSSFVTYYIPQSIFNPDKACDMFYTDIKHTATSTVLGILCVLLMIFGIIRLSSARWLLLTYLMTTFGVLLLYQEQFSGLRYMVPVMPLLIFAFLAGLTAVTDTVAAKCFKTDGKWCCILLLTVLSFVLSLRLVGEQKTYRQLAAIKSEKGLPQTSPYKQYVDASVFFTKAPDNYIVACRKPEVFHYFSRYHKCVSIPRSATPEELVEMMRETRVNAVILDCWFPQAHQVLLPAIQQYPEHFSLLRQFGESTPSTFVFSFIP